MGHRTISGRACSGLLAATVLFAACSSAVVPAPALLSTLPATHAPRTPAPTPFDPATLRYPATAESFIAALSSGREDDAYRLIGEHFLFGVDCDYANRKLFYITDRESAAYWLHLRIADHERIDILRMMDGGRYQSALRFQVRRSSDSIRRAGYADGSVQPSANLVLRFSVDGSQVVQWGWEFGSDPAPVNRFPECGA